MPVCNWLVNGAMGTHMAGSETRLEQYCGCTSHAMVEIDQSVVLVDVRSTWTIMAGMAPSVRVMTWSWISALPQSSTSIQVRVMVMPTTQSAPLVMSL